MRTSGYVGDLERASFSRWAHVLPADGNWFEVGSTMMVGSSVAQKTAFRHIRRISVLQLGVVDAEPEVALSSSGTASGLLVRRCRSSAWFEYAIAVTFSIRGERA